MTERVPMTTTMGAATFKTALDTRRLADHFATRAEITSIPQHRGLLNTQLCSF